MCSINNYLKSDDYDGGQLADVKIIANKLKKYDININNKYIMAIHFAYTYYAGSNFLMSPLIL